MSYSLSGNSFLQAYRKFIARRGIPDIIFSDNATNFQFGAKIVKKLSKETWCSQEVQDWVAHKGTQWRFTTPHNPREGGIWERMIRVVKNSMRRSIGRQLLDHAELETLFIELEAMVNSRPLTYQSEEEPVRSLRPIDFLVQSSPEINFANLGEDSDYEEELNREQGLKQIRVVNNKLNKMWEIWKSQYLLSLRERRENRGKGSGKEPVVGSVVIVEDNLPRPLWSLGRIIELRKGRDGLVRTVKLKINGKIFNRSINQIYNLEILDPPPLGKQPQMLDKNIEKEVSSSEDEDVGPFPAYARPRKATTEPISVNVVLSATNESSVLEEESKDEDKEETISLISLLDDDEIEILEVNLAQEIPKEVENKEAKKSEDEKINNNNNNNNNEVARRTYPWRKSTPFNWLNKYKIPRRPMERKGKGTRIFLQNGVNMYFKAMGEANASNEARMKMVARSNAELKRQKFRKIEERALRRYQGRYELNKHERCPRQHQLDWVDRAVRQERREYNMSVKEMWGAPDVEMENNVWSYDIFTRCEGKGHEGCQPFTTASRTAHSRPLPIQVIYPIMTTLAHLLIFNWFSRQKFGSKEVWVAVTNQLFAPNESAMFKMLKFWQHIKEAPTKSFRMKFLVDIIALKGHHCKVFRSLYNNHWSGSIKLKLPPDTPIPALNEWLKFITEMLSKVLTRKKFLGIQGTGQLYLIDAPIIVAADMSIQSIEGWGRKEDCRLVYFDGERDLHKIIYFGIKARDLFVVIHPDEEIMSSLTNSLQFWRCNGTPIRITLVHREDKVDVERRKYDEQFRNLAESFNTGYLSFNGSTANLREVRAKFLRDPDQPSTSVASSNNIVSFQVPLQQQPQQPQLLNQQVERPSLEQRLRELINRISQPAIPQPAPKPTANRTTKNMSGSLIKNVGAMLMIFVLLMCFIGFGSALVTKTQVSTPAGRRVRYRVSASPYLTRKFQESHSEQDRVRRKDTGHEISGEPVYWCAKQSRALWRFPNKDNATFCRKGFYKWKPFSFETFSQVVQPQVIDAYICSAKYTREVYYSNLLGDKFVELEQRLLVVSKEECLKMVENKICPHNKKEMIKKDGLWKTEEILKVDFPGRFASLFGGAKESSAINCHLQPTTIHYDPQSLKLFSPLYEVEKCHYVTDFCALPDNSSIIWDSQCETKNCKSCNYDYLGRWDGDYSRSGDTRVIWVSSSKEVALSFTSTAERDVACNGRTIRKSEQGFAIEESAFIRLFTDRGKRSVDEEQLAAELTATEFALKAFYDKLIEEKCQQQTIRHDNPTYHVRQAFHKKNLVATWLNDDTAEVFSCVPLDVKNLKFRPVPSCYKYIPVEVTLLNRTQLGFLDPELRILSESSIRADCERYRLRYFEVDPDHWIRINTETGVWEKVDQSKIHVFYDNATAPDMSVSPIVFHEWILRNRTEEPVFVHVNELTQYETWKATAKSEESDRAIAIGALPGGLRQVATDWLWSKWYFIVEWWKTLSCLYATFLFLREVGIPLLTVYLIFPVWSSILVILGRGSRTAPQRGERSRRSTRSQDAVELASIAPRRQRTNYFPRRGSNETIRTQESTRLGRLISPIVGRH
uniref:Integrase catalytic domain-containing protein n=1 Tax=Meloidogyne enterolobii TaxID=390850 RepID=A0A6V7X1L5_MELEN|nr:unnamed protein product [Meloidogyne enterolobii]